MLDRRKPVTVLALGLCAGLSLPALSLAQAVGCLVEPDRVADVGSQIPGVLDRLLVERGDPVRAGQVLARLSAQVERASLSVAETRSQAEAEYRQALAASALASSKLERARQLLRQDFISSQALDQAVAEAAMADQRVAQAREAQRVARKEYQLSSAQLEQKDIRSPFDGVVVERYLTEGEHIERQPAVRVARINPLRIEAIVPVAKFGTIVSGQWFKIKTDLTHLGDLTAQVVLVDRVVDPASNSFRVRLTMANPEHKIPAGLRCRVDFAARTSPPEPDKPSAPSATVSTVSPEAVKSAAVGSRPVGSGHWAMARLVNPAQAPGRPLVKQYIMSREPRLSMSRQFSAASMVALTRIERTEAMAMERDRKLYSMR